MSKFVLTAQINLQAPTNTSQVVNQISSQLQGITVPISATGAKQTAAAIQKVTTATQKADTAAQSLGRSMGMAVKRYAQFVIASKAISLVTSSLSSAFEEAIDFQRQMVKISQVTGKTVGQLRSLQKVITDLSVGLGTSSKDLVGVTRILAQAGIAANDLKIALTSLAKTTLAPTFENIEQTAEGAIAILRQFGEGVGALERQLGAINAVAGQFAVEAGDLIGAVRRFGGVFKAAGGSLEELIALFTSVRATTRESAESISTGLRTIFTRIQRPKTIAFLKQMGISLTDMEGKFVGPFEAAKRLSEALSNLQAGDIGFIRIAEELGGFRQIGKVIPLLQQFETAERARQAALEGGNSLTQDAVTAQQALAVQFTKTKEEFQRLILGIADSSSFMMFAKVALNLAGALIKIGDAIKPLIPLMATFAAFKLAGVMGGFLGGAGKAIAGVHEGGRIRKFASGGLVPGSGNRDTVPAALTPGEFVIRKSSVKKMGAAKLQAMNDNKMALGGKVGIISLSSSSGKTFQEKDGTVKGKHLAKAVGTRNFKGTSGNFNDDKTKGTPFVRGKYNPDLPEPNKAKLEALFKAKEQKVKAYGYPLKAASSESAKIDDEVEQIVTDQAIAGISEIGGKLGSVLGINSVKPADEDSVKEVGVASMVGKMFEAGLTLLDKEKLAGKKKSDDEAVDSNAAFDYAGGIGDKIAKKLPEAAQVLKGIPTDAKKVLYPGKDGLGDAISIKAKNVIAEDIARSGAWATAKAEAKEAILAAQAAEKPKGTGKKSVTGKASGGPIRGYAAGGTVDTVPALLTPGEFVVNKKSAQNIGYANLNSMNKRGVSKFASGGAVGGVQKFAMGGVGAAGIAVAGMGMAMQAIEKFGDKTLEASDAQAKTTIGLQHAVKAITMMIVTFMLIVKMRAGLAAWAAEGSKAKDSVKGLGEAAKASGQTQAATPAGGGGGATGGGGGGGGGTPMTEKEIAKGGALKPGADPGGLGRDMSQFEFDPSKRSVLGDDAKRLPERLASDVVEGANIERSRNVAQAMDEQQGPDQDLAAAQISREQDKTSLQNADANLEQAHFEEGLAKTEVTEARGTVNDARQEAATAADEESKVGEAQKENVRAQGVAASEIEGAQFDAANAEAKQTLKEERNTKALGEKKQEVANLETEGEGLEKAQEKKTAQRVEAEDSGADDSTISRLKAQEKQLADERALNAAETEEAANRVENLTRHEQTLKGEREKVNAEVADLNAEEKRQEAILQGLKTEEKELAAARVTAGNKVAAANQKVIDKDKALTTSSVNYTRTLDQTNRATETSRKAMAKRIGSEKTLTKAQLKARKATVKTNRAHNALAKGLLRQQKAAKEAAKAEKKLLKQRKSAATGGFKGKMKRGAAKAGRGLAAAGGAVAAIAGIGSAITGAMAEIANREKEKAIKAGDVSGGIKSAGKASVMESVGSVFTMGGFLEAAMDPEGFAEGMMQKKESAEAETGVQIAADENARALKEMMDANNGRFRDAAGAVDVSAAAGFMGSTASTARAEIGDVKSQSQRAKLTEQLNASIKGSVQAFVDSGASAADIMGNLDMLSGGNVKLRAELEKLAKSALNLRAAQEQLAKANFDSLKITSAFAGANAAVNMFTAGLTTGSDSLGGYIAQIEAARGTIGVDASDAIEATRDQLLASAAGSDPGLSAAIRGQANVALAANQFSANIGSEVSAGDVHQGNAEQAKEDLRRMMSAAIPANADQATKDQLQKAIDAKLEGITDKNVRTTDISKLIKEVAAEGAKLSAGFFEAAKLQSVHNKRMSKLYAEKEKLELKSAMAFNKAIDAQLQAAKIFEQFGGVKATTGQKLQARVSQFNNIGELGGLNAQLGSGSASDIRRVSSQIGDTFNRQNREVVGDTIVRGTIGAKAGPGIFSGAGGHREDMRPEAKRANAALLKFTKDRIKLLQEELKIVQKKNAAEKSALDKLISGDVAGFIEGQAAAGAAAALKTGDAGLAGMFGASALGAGFKTLQGQGLSDRDMEQAAGLTLGSVGIEDQRANQIMAGSTAEEEAIKSAGRDMAGVMGELAQQGANFEKAELHVKTAVIHATELNFARNLKEVSQANMSRGGPVYASRGMFIPRGTDTVPAMLTPGEYVINRSAVKRGNNLQILRAMNSGGGASAPSAMSGGGQVGYYQFGGLVEGISNVFSNAMPGLNTAFSGFAETVQKLMSTKFQVALDPTNINVNFNGGSFLTTMKDEIRTELLDEVKREIEKAKPNTSGDLGTNTTVLGN